MPISMCRHCPASLDLARCYSSNARKRNFLGPHISGKVPDNCRAELHKSNSIVNRIQDILMMVTTSAQEHPRPGSELSAAHDGLTHASVFSMSCDRLCVAGCEIGHVRNDMLAVFRIVTRNQGWRTRQIRQIPLLVPRKVSIIAESVPS